MPGKKGQKKNGKKRGGDDTNKTNKRIKSMVAQAVADHLDKKEPTVEAKKPDTEADKALGYLVSLIEAGQNAQGNKKVVIAATEAMVATDASSIPRHSEPITLQSILKQATGWSPMACQRRNKKSSVFLSIDYCNPPAGSAASGSGLWAC